MNLPDLTSRYLKIFFGFIAGIFIVNVILLDFFLVSQRNDLVDFQTKLTQLSDSFRILGGRLYTAADQTGEATPAAQIFAPVNGNSCPVACLDLITLATNAAKLSTQSLVSPVFQTTVPTTTTVTNKGEFFVPMGNGSIGQTNDWTNIDSAQASFDASNYGSIKAAYFEVFLRAQSGEVHTRLFDTTTPAILWGSEVTTNSQSTTFLSGQINLTGGQKTYKVQMYSTIGTGYLDQARIRIVTQ